MLVRNIFLILYLYNINIFHSTTVISKIQEIPRWLFYKIPRYGTIGNKTWFIPLSLLHTITKFVRLKSWYVWTYLSFGPCNPRQIVWNKNGEVAFFRGSTLKGQKYFCTVNFYYEIHWIIHFLNALKEIFLLQQSL